MAISKTQLDALEGYCRDHMKELLTVAMLSGEWKKNYNLMAGIKDELMLTALVLKSVVKPWIKDWNPKASTGDLIPRILKVRMGQVEEEEVPTAYRNSWLAKQLTGGVDSTDHPFEAELLMAIIAQINEDIYLKALWDGVYDAAGVDPEDLFNGFNTIINAEVTAGNISATPNGTNKLKWANLHPTGTIDATNAVDKLKKMYRDVTKAAKAYKDKPMNAYISTDVYDFYCDDYQASFGALPYNTQYEKVTLEGSRGLLTLVPEPAQSVVQRVAMTPKENMIYGVDLDSDQESLIVRQGNNLKAIQIFGEFAAGVQIGTLQAFFLNV